MTDNGIATNAAAARPAVARSAAIGHRRALSLGAIAAAVALYVAANLLAGSTGSTAKLDLTEDKLYTLSDGTREVLKGIEEPITLRFYYSEQLGRVVPTYAVYAERVRDLLATYVDLAGGKLRLEQQDPLPFSDAEDRAVAFGLQGVPVDQTGELVYFGLAGTNAVDGKEVVPFFQPEREAFLEYDLTKLVSTLATTKKPVVGMLSTLPVAGGPTSMSPFGGPQYAEPWVAYSQLGQFFDTKTIGADVTRIPDEMQVLIVVHPAGLSEATLYAIDQFVMRGGRLIAFVDPNSEAAQLSPAARGMGPPTAESSTLGKLFTAWGIAFDADKVVTDRQLARRVSTGRQEQMGAVDYVVWLDAGRRQLDPSDVLTADLQRLTFATAGALSLTEEGGKSGITLQPLVLSSPIASTVAAEKVRGEPDPVKLLTEAKPGLQSLILAARYSGGFKTAFPDGAPNAAAKPDDKPEAAAKPDEPKATPEPLPPHRAATEKPGAILVIADTDMLQDRFWVRVQSFFGQQVATPFAQNGDFLINAVDNMLGASALIGLRSRGVSARPFTVIDDLRREAEARFRETEKALRDKLKETERKLDEARKGEGGAESRSLALTPEQDKVIDGFRAELVGVRQELRAVQRALREDIEAAEARVRWLNILVMPAIVTVIAIILAFTRRARRRRAVAA